MRHAAAAPAAYPGPVPAYLIGSVGSVLSVGSIGSGGSFLSVGSAGSAASVMSAGTVGSLLSAGTRDAVLGRPASASERRLGALLLVALGALLLFRRLPAS